MMASQQKSKLASKFITLCYDNFPIQREFVFSMKGRPFSMLSSQSLPVPSVSLIDFNLVNDLNLKMSDLQCAKFSYGGQKLRILGRISQTVQTITDGVISGTVHIRANVVEDLRKTFDCHSIAGKKMMEMLSKENAATVSPPASPTPSATSSTEASPPVKTVQTLPDDSVQTVQTFSDGSQRISRGSGASQVPVTSEVSVSTLTGAPNTSGSPVTSSSRRHLPPLSSPKPLGKHRLTTWRVPQLKENLCPGIPRRTIPSRPDSSHFYGRVVSVSELQLQRDSRPTGKKVVEVEFLQDNGEVSTAYPIAPYFLARGLRVNDAVLFKVYDSMTEAKEDGHQDTTPIMVVYSKDEEAELTSRGAYFPDCPPEMLPDGYYG